MKKLQILITLVLFSLLILNVQCWSQKDKGRSNNKDEASKNDNTKKFERPQPRGRKISQNQANQNLKDKLKNDPKLQQMQQDLDKPVDPETGIPLEEQKKIDDQIKDIDEEIQKEEDEQRKQEQLKAREQKLEEIRKNTEKIRQQRAKLQEDKQNREEQLQKEQEEEQQRNENERLKAENERLKEEQLQRENMTAEEIEQQIKNKGQFNTEENIKDEDMTKWLEDWEKHMQDFKADEMLSFEVAARGFEVFFEDITTPCTIRGAYFINFDAKDGLDLKILDPKNKEVYKNVGKRQGIFTFETTEVGAYQFYFQNRRSSQKKTVSFVVDVSDNETHLQSKDIDDISSTSTQIKADLRLQLQEYKVVRRQNKIFERKRKSASTKIFVASIIETIFIIACTVFQVMYIKKILDNKSFV